MSPDHLALGEPACPADGDLAAGDGHRVSRAYTGPAHDRQWTVGVGAAPAPTVRLLVADRECRYELLIGAYGSPVRDGRGRYVYIPRD